MHFFEKALPVWPENREREMNLICGFYTPIAWDGEKKMMLRLAASSFYHLYINGMHAGYGPARGPHNFYRVDSIDLTPYLMIGENHLALEVTAINANTYFWPKQPAFLQAEIWENDHPIFWTAPQDGGFSCCLPGYRMQKVERYSFQRGFSEGYRLFPQWNQWRMGGETAPVTLEQQPPKQLMDRNFPAFSFPAIYPAETIAHLQVRQNFSAGRHCRYGYLSDAAKNHDGYARDALECLISDEVAALETTKITPCQDAFSPDCPISIHPNEGALLRFQGEQCGFLSMEISCRQPCTLYAIYDEILVDQDINPFRLSLMPFIKIEVSPGIHTFVSSEPVGIQYLKLICLENECAVRHLSLLEAASPVPITANYQAPDGELAAIFQAAVTSYRQNALDIYTDCPTRERAGWCCDSFFQGRAEKALTGGSASEKIFLENFFLPASFANLPKGALPMCYPADHPNGRFIPNWVLWLMLQLEEYFHRTGDQAMVDLARPHMEAALAYFEGFENADGLLEKLESWVFVEWSEANKLVQDVNYPSSMLYAGALDAMGRLYQWPRLLEKAARIRQSILRLSFDGKNFVDNALIQPDGTRQNTGKCTETCQYYAFFFDVATPESHPELWNRLLADYQAMNAPDGGLYPANAFIGKALRMLLLERYGLKEFLCQDIRAVYGDMARRTGTLWEHLGTQASCNHGFASIVGQLLLENQ